jgi:hypothetical protein
VRGLSTPLRCAQETGTGERFFAGCVSCLNDVSGEGRAPTDDLDARLVAAGADTDVVDAGVLGDDVEELEGSCWGCRRRVGAHLFR